MKIIGIDIDGVLANFNARYRDMLVQVTGRDLIPVDDCSSVTADHTPPCWNYAPVYGYTREEDSRTWVAIRDSPDFWMSPDPLPAALPFLWALQASDRRTAPEYYFITTRPGASVKYQTERWLQNLGFYNPTVLITRGDKGQLAAGLGLTHFIDDRPENCLDVRAARGERCRVFLLDARYNRAQQDECRLAGIEVIPSLSAFQEVLREQ